MAVRTTRMQTSMHASSSSVDSHHAALISSDNTTIALMSYDVGLFNKEVQSQIWAKTGRKRLKLKSDVQKIFKNQHGIQIALISEMGNMLDKLSHSSGGSHPTPEAIFESINCELIDNLCDEKNSSFSNSFSSM